MQVKNNIILICKNAIKFLYVAGALYFVITSVVTLHYFRNTHKQVENLIAYVRQNQRDINTENVLTIKPFKPASKAEIFLSGYHIADLELTDNEQNWMNVAFARYYGIKGIRMLKEDKHQEAGNVENKCIKTESVPAGSQSR